MSITAVILCGGQGTRLRPVIGDLPKCLAPVAGKPFLCYILDQLHATRIEKVALCTGYKGKEVEDFFGPNYAGLPLVYSHETEPLGTGGALRHALPLLDSDPVLVLNGDTFCKFNLEYADKLLNAPPFLTFSMNRSGVILYHQNRDTSSGVRLVRKKLIERIPEGCVDLDQWVTTWSGHHLHVGRVVGDFPFHDIGTPEGYAGAEEFLRQQGVIT